MTPEGPERTILSHPSPSLPLALRTADRSIIRRTPFRGKKKKKGTVHIGGWTFSTWCIARKTFRYKKGPFSHERREEILSSLLSLSREGKKEDGGRGGMGPVPFFYGRHSYLSAVRNYRLGLGGKGKAWAYLSR
jgi:hypothetical protein